MYSTYVYDIIDIIIALFNFMFTVVNLATL